VGVGLIFLLKVRCSYLTICQTIPNYMPNSCFKDALPDGIKIIISFGNGVFSCFLSKFNLISKMIHLDDYLPSYTIFYISLDREFYGELEYIIFISGFLLNRCAVPSLIIFLPSRRREIFPFRRFARGGRFSSDELIPCSETLALENPT
jgi:hypothetical protein